MKNVREIRDSQGYTRDYVSENTGISRAYLQRIEEGQKPSIDVIHKLADFYGKDPDMFAAEYFGVLPDRIYKQALQYFINAESEEV